MRAPTGCTAKSHCTVGRHALMPPPLPGRLRGTGRCGHRPLQISTAPVGAAISRPRVDADIDPYAACCNYVRRGGCPHPPVGLWPLRGRVDEGIDPYHQKNTREHPGVFSYPNIPVDKYRSPRSGSSTTTVLPWNSGLLVSCTAAKSAAPPLGPVRIPSVLLKSLAMP